MSDVEQSDAMLVQAAIASPEQYGEIITRYEDALLRYIRRLTNVNTQDAEDIPQTVFIKAYRNLTDFDQNLTLSTWLFRIAHNEVISNHRKRAARATESELDETLFELPSQSASAPDELDTALQKQSIGLVLTRIKPAYRDVLTLYYFEEKNYTEISDILRMPIGTVGSLVSRAKKAFREKAEEMQITSRLSPSSHD